MKDINKILEMLHLKNISFCFNFQARNEYYNLKVEDIHGETHYLVDNNIEDINKRLKVIWGHLLKPSKAIPTMPKPPGA